MNFINLPTAGGRGSRRIFPVPSLRAPSVDLYVGYDPELDATVAEVPYGGEDDAEFSLILALPGKPGEFVAGGLSKLESKLTSETWNSLLHRMARRRVDLQVPLFDHRSVMTSLNESFFRLGLTSAFQPFDSDLTGINGDRDLWVTLFAQLDQVVFGPAAPSRSDRQDHGHDGHDPEVEDEGKGQALRLHYERQFLYVVRHSGTGLIIHIGRYYEPDEHHHHHHHHEHQDGHDLPHDLHHH